MKKTEVLDFDVIFDLLYINILFFLSKEQLEKITEGMFYFYLFCQNNGRKNFDSGGLKFDAST